MSNISPSARARTIGVDVVSRNLRTATPFLPQKLLLLGQPNTGVTPPSGRPEVFTALEVGETYGYGSPLHQAAKGVFANQTGLPVYVAAVADGTTAATGSITASGAATADGTIQITIGGITGPVIVIPSGTAAADVPALIIAGMSGNIDLPTNLTDGGTGTTTVTAKYKGENGNDIKISAAAGVTGLTFAITAMTSGAGNPDPSTVLDSLLGEEWVTIVVNAIGTDSTTLNALSAASDERWAGDVRRAFVAIAGSNADALSTSVTITENRTTDKTNCIKPVLGSPDTPAYIAGASAGETATVADRRPAWDYAGQQLFGITPGEDNLQPNYAAKDSAFKKGVGSTRVEGNAVFMNDTITPYRLPNGDPDPLYRYVADLMKIWQGWYGLELIFTASEWNGAPLVPSAQVTSANVGAKTPEMAIAAVNSLIDSLALAAVFVNPDEIKETVTATIDPNNPKRLNISFIAQISGNTNIISIDYGVGFNFGGA